jgi:cell fate regulator YaaT (PSP1 superfamily)
MKIKVIGIDCLFSGSVVEIPFSEKIVVQRGDEVVFKDAEGKEEYGVVKFVNQDAEEPDKVSIESKVLRMATPNDTQKTESHIELSRPAFDHCVELVEKLKLPMQVFRAAFSFDGARAHFMFTADERIDFRDLVKELSRILKKQIYLRQVGPRDKAKFIGGFGKCGRELCCTTFLGKLESVGMDMVRVQGLEGKGSSKLSGACGKLLCCLRYEVETYNEFRKNLPPIGSILKLSKKAAPAENACQVIALDVLNQKLRVVLDLANVEKVVKRGRGERGVRGEIEEAEVSDVPIEQA